MDSESSEIPRSAFERVRELHQRPQFTTITKDIINPSLKHNNRSTYHSCCRAFNKRCQAKVEENEIISGLLTHVRSTRLSVIFKLPKDSQGRTRELTPDEAWEQFTDWVEKNDSKHDFFPPFKVDQRVCTVKEKALNKSSTAFDLLGQIHVKDAADVNINYYKSWVKDLEKDNAYLIDKTNKVDQENMMLEGKVYQLETQLADQAEEVKIKLAQQAEVAEKAKIKLAQQEEEATMLSDKLAEANVKYASYVQLEEAHKVVRASIFQKQLNLINSLMTEVEDLKKKVELLEGPKSEYVPALISELRPDSGPRKPSKRDR